MRKVINSSYKNYVKVLDNIILNFETTGKAYGDQDRNRLRLFELQGQTLNVKSFKKPNVINKIIYKYFRKSKAQRSFEYANKLIELGIGTPNPIAFYEINSGLVFGESYYVSEHLNYDITFRELTSDFNLPNHETVLRAFTRFTFGLHEQGVNFLDHSPGNTLIQYNKDDYLFYLVDLNRMTFEAMTFEARIKNFSKLTSSKAIVEVMSSEYSKCIGVDYNLVFDLMWRETKHFQEKIHKRANLKKRYKFWKKWQS